MKLSKNKSLKNLFILLVLLVIFGSLMIFGLKHNPNFTPSLLVGKTVPFFKSELSDGIPFELSPQSNNNNWKIINFWSSGCIICRQEASDLENFYETITHDKENKTQFISINIQDNVTTIQQWKKDYSLTFPVVLDSKGLISVNFGVTGTPETFFVDPSNIVRYRIAGTVNTPFILKFIQWFEAHPNSTEQEASKFLTKINSGV